LPLGRNWLTVPQAVASRDNLWRFALHTNSLPLVGGGSAHLFLSLARRPKRIRPRGPCAPLAMTSVKLPSVLTSMWLEEMSGPAPGLRSYQLPSVAFDHNRGLRTIPSATPYRHVFYRYNTHKRNPGHRCSSTPPWDRTMRRTRQLGAHEGVPLRSCDAYVPLRQPWPCAGGV